MSNMQFDQGGMQGISNAIQGLNPQMQGNFGFGGGKSHKTSAGGFQTGGGFERETTRGRRGVTKTGRCDPRSEATRPYQRVPQGQITCSGKTAEQVGQNAWNSQGMYYQRFQNQADGLCSRVNLVDEEGRPMRGHIYPDTYQRLSQEYRQAGYEVPPCNVNRSQQRPANYRPPVHRRQGKGIPPLPSGIRLASRGGSAGMRQGGAFGTQGVRHGARSFDDWGY